MVPKDSEIISEFNTWYKNTQCSSSIILHQGILYALEEKLKVYPNIQVDDLAFGIELMGKFCQTTAEQLRRFAKEKTEEARKELKTKKKDHKKSKKKK